MERTIFNKCLNKEVKYYGLKLTGLIAGAIVGFIILVKFNFTFALIGSVGGYVLGAEISSYWHLGYIQRWCYWNLPTQLFARSKYFPKSCVRRFL